MGWVGWVGAIIPILAVGGPSTVVEHMAECDGTIGMIEDSYRAWFTDLAPGAEVAEEWRSERAQSTITRYRITDGTAVRSIMVKRNVLSADVPNRPRLGLRSGFEKKHLLEAAALDAIRFKVLDGGVFDSVRVLDMLPDGLILDVVDGKTLGSMLRGRRPAGVDQLVRSSGELLREVHDVALDVVTVRSTGSELAESFGQFCGFLRSELDAEPGLSRQLAEIAERLPDLGSLKVGLGHGDFAPRNVLVGEGRRLSIIDPLGCQRSPVEEDLAYFAMALRHGALISWPASSLERLATRLEKQLLAGYGISAGFRYHAIAALVSLDAMAADKVRPAGQVGAVRQLSTRLLPRRIAVLQRSVSRAVETELTDGLDR